MRFIYNQPVLYHLGAIIIGDTHFGIEDRLKGSGLHYSHISDRISDKIILLAKKTRAKKLIILGDVKENILHVDAITENIFIKLQKLISVTVVRGNHDGSIESVCNDVKPSKGFLYGNLGLIHGNAWPSEALMSAKYLISAHQHPQIEFKDKSGKIHKEPVRLVLPPNKIKIKKFYKIFNKDIQLILLPAFNPLVGKTIKSNAAAHLGPLLYNKLFKLNEALAYRLNGISLGKLKNFEP